MSVRKIMSKKKTANHEESLGYTTALPGQMFWHAANVVVRSRSNTTLYRYNNIYRRQLSSLKYNMVLVQIRSVTSASGCLAIMDSEE